MEQALHVLDSLTGKDRISARVHIKKVLKNEPIEPFWAYEELNKITRIDKVRIEMNERTEAGVWTYDLFVNGGEEIALEYDGQKDVHEDIAALRQIGVTVETDFE